ncbi:MAG TPA: aquaporin [candidate division Zixibacteria bacterium]|nr:aquaporin [candidate division Zixibacteria bacterium]
MLDRRGAALVAEAVGTFLFFFVGAGSVVLATHAGEAGPGLVGIALAHGLALAVLVSAFGAISGGHFNPAVTVAVRLAGGIEWGSAMAYVIAQLLGAVVAGFALRAVFPEASWQPSAIGTPALGEGISVGAGIAIEAVLTLLLVLTVFGTAIDRRAPKLGGLAIGLAVAADILMGGPLTGAAMNPARWFGPAVAAGQFADWYVWWVGPLLGGIVAAVIYRYALADTAEADVTPATPEG